MWIKSEGALHDATQCTIRPNIEKGELQLVPRSGKAIAICSGLDELQLKAAIETIEKAIVNGKELCEL